jgi:hypothetical protein
VPIGVGGGVFTSLGDLPHPHGCGVTEPGLGLEQFGALATTLAKLVLQGALCRGPRRSPTFNAAGHSVEVTDPAAGHPLTTFSGDLYRPMMPERERWTGHEILSDRDFRRVFDRLDLPGE